jgi:hypothetical protein
MARTVVRVALALAAASSTFAQVDPSPSPSDTASVSASPSMTPDTLSPTPSFTPTASPSPGFVSHLRLKSGGDVCHEDALPRICAPGVTLRAGDRARAQGCFHRRSAVLCARRSIFAGLEALVECGGADALQPLASVLRRRGSSDSLVRALRPGPSWALLTFTSYPTVDAAGRHGITAPFVVVRRERRHKEELRVMSHARRACRPAPVVLVPSPLRPARSATTCTWRTT